MESARDLEQRALLVATETALAAEATKEAQERASREAELVARHVH